MTRSGNLTRLLRRGALALLCGGPALVFAQERALPNVAAQASPSEPTVELTLPQARDLARRALADGQPDLARSIATGLLQADARSGFANYVIARAEDTLGRPAEARRAAKLAYRHADRDAQRFEAAQMAARMFYAAESPTRAQLWLRRAIEHAPDDTSRRELERAYKVVRAQNPLSFSLSGGIRPSNNVNNGAESALQIIDGLPYVGTLSGSAQALSGVIGHVDGAIGYRLRGTKTSRTTLGGRLYVKRVALDDDARALAPGSRNSDFGSTYAAVTLSHAVAREAGAKVLSFDATLGQYWSGGARSYDFIRVGARHGWRLGAQDRLSLDASVELRDAASGSLWDTQRLTLGVSSSHDLAQAGKLSLAFNLHMTEGDLANARSEGAAISAVYHLGQQIGPMALAAGVTASHTDYPDYTALFAVPGGRQDLSISAHLDLTFPDVDYAGFAPALRVTTGRTRSNVSRFDTRELSVTLGVRSTF